MRHCFRAESLPFDLDGLKQAFEPIADEFEMDWHLNDSGQSKKVILMASKESHCLVDLLHRWHSKELVFDIPCVISNHDTLRSLVEWHGIPFFHVPVDKDNKSEHFRRVNAIVEENQADTIADSSTNLTLPTRESMEVPWAAMTHHDTNERYRRE